MSISNITTYQIGLAQVQAYRRLQDLFRIGLLPFGLTIPEWTLLGVVFDAEELTLSQITALLKSKASHPTVLVDALVGRGLLDRRSDSFDRRSRLVTLTPKGKQMVPQIEKHVRAHLSHELRTIPYESLLNYYSVLAMLSAMRD
jgi:DNA-binding MarR family transcriptional regulator